ncbi:DNA repair protein RecO [Pseudocolwellia sp. AS88]|uniref:DNA repair protein RecO n=1 Tax=Pseudocolwellia sp. AS88 TaxID=3063958 RepID=UPI0026EB6929|nr:DNA repair protein RecO [Pseudocolwellia sp. AS88]MDO7084387.1 DNA repair protein RecO [Pseudocolwellia sp. AS88]
MEATEQEAFILHSKPFKDNQLIVDLLTEQSGKVSAVVYTGKTQKSNKKGLLQPFLPLQVVLKGKGQLKNLSRIETSQRSYPLSGNYVFCGFYLNELLIKLLGEHIECPELFYQYKMSLQSLAEQQPVEQNLRSFEMTLLDELGQSFDFSDVFESQENYFYYILEEGFVPVLSKLNIPKYSREHLLAIAEERLEDERVLRTFKLLMRQVINNLLGGKPLNSRKLFTR